MAITSEPKRAKQLGHTHKKPSVWEHVAGVVGAAIVLATLAFMMYEALTTPSDPVPKLAVSIDTVVSYPDGYVVEFRAVNSGHATAANVQVQGELKTDTGVVERSESTIAFVPAESWRTGGLVFKAEPARHRLEVRVVGYDRP